MERVAIVTGGSRGIGRAIVEDLARKNIKIIANYNQSEEKDIEKFHISLFQLKGMLNLINLQKKIAQFLQ